MPEDYIAPFRMAGNLYFVGTYPASSHLIDTGAGLILIDTGYEHTAPVIVESMQKLGYDIADVKIILHSHGHYDHTDGTQVLLPMCHAKTYLGREDLRYIKGFTPDEYYSDGQVIELGNTRITCLHTPGHTLGTYSFFWDIEVDGKIYRAGMFGGAGYNQLKKPYLDRKNLFYFQRADYLASIERLKGEHVDIFVGNHAWNNKTPEKAAILAETGENPFINDAEWVPYLNRCARKLRGVMHTESRELFVNYAHRGASEYCPENTALSFDRGLEMGANGIETDLRMTRDGEIVLFHDDTLTRVTGEDGCVAEKTLAELQNMQIKKGDTCDKMMRFEDFLEKYSAREITFAIELKADGFYARAAELLRKYDMQAKTVITSFRLDFLRAFHAEAPEFKLGYLTKEVSAELLDELKAAEIDELCPRATLITSPEVVDTWHEAGFRVRAWGVKTEELMRAVYDCGADGMTVNFPDKLQTYIATCKQTEEV